MTVASSGVGSLNQYPVNFQLMRMLLLTAKTRAPFFAGTNPGMLMKNAGTTSVKWERIENLSKATTPLSEISGASLALPTRQGVVPTITPVTASMVKYGNVIQLTEELELMSVNARAMKFMETLGENAGASYNEIMATEFANATQIRYAGGVGSTAACVTAISANDVKFAYNQINRQGGQHFQPDGNGSVNIGTSPIRASYLGICHVDVEEDLRAIPGFVSCEQYGGYVSLYPYEIGTLNGVRWLATEEDSLINAGAGTTSAAGFRGAGPTANDVYSSYIMAQDAVGSVGLGEQHTQEIYMTGDRLPTIEMIYHQAGSSGVADPLNEISTIGWKGWLVGKILNNTWIVKLETLSSSLA